MRESIIEKSASAYAESRGWFEVKISATSKRGFPDRFYARQGVVVLVEYKAPCEVPTAQQKIRHSELKVHGITVYVIDSIESAYAIFR